MQGMFSIGLADHQIGCGLEQSQQGEKKEKQPAPETSETQFQG